MLVNGSAFEVHGVSYGSPPVGRDWSFDWSTAPGMYTIDFPLLKAMGCNTIRLYNAPANNPDGIAAMNAAYNSGLYVIMCYDPAWGLDYTQASVQNDIKNGFKSMVNTWKDHPAVLMWMLGNENMMPNGVAISTPNAIAWYHLVNDCAGAAHAAEGAHFHPVGTANVDLVDMGNASRGADDASVPNLDVWAAQVYRGNKFYGAPAQYAPRSSKPLLISEYGLDSWDTLQNKENQQAQADGHKSLWDDLKPDLSTRYAGKVCLGGVIHMFADDWSRVGNNSVHDTAGNGHVDNLYDTSGSSNQNWQDEWVGLVSIAPDGSYAKTPKAAYYTLQAEWEAPITTTTIIVTSVNTSLPLFNTPVKNYPNPFKPGESSTRIECALNFYSRVTMEIYDVSMSLVKREVMADDKYVRYYWNGKDDSGHTVAPGIYIVRMLVEANNTKAYGERKIVVIK